MSNSAIDAGSLFRVDGLVAVITGGATGIGLMMAQALEANGAIVYILGRRAEVLQAAAKTSVGSFNFSPSTENAAKHGNIYVIEADVTSKEDLQRAAAEVKSARGYVNLVVANSGIGGPSLKELKPNPSLSEFSQHLLDWDSDVFTNVFSVNVTGAFYTVAAFLDLLGEGNKQNNVQQRSQVIVTSSIGAYNRIPGLGYAYAGSKAAVLHIFKQLSTTLVPFDIRANIIVPGLYPSEMAVDLIEQAKQNGVQKSYIPAERAGDIQDMAGTILFLASRAGGYVNGNVLVTDGGRLAVIPATY